MADVEPDDREVAIVEHRGVLLIQGPRDLVDQLVAGDPALCRSRPSPSKGLMASGAMSHLANVVGGQRGHQVVFELDSAGRSMFEKGVLTSAKGGGGWLRLSGQGADGAFTAQGALRPLTASPQQVLTAQMALLTLSLTAAIKEVQEAVERVEDKVDLINDLVGGERTGRIVGAHRSLSRRAEQLGFNGSMADVDWYAIDDVGIQVEQQIESLRSFIRLRLTAAEGRGERITGRLDALDEVQEISSALALLVVAQDSLFIFQQLRLCRVRDTEPDRLQAAVEEGHDLISRHKEEDADLLERVREVVDQRVSVKALEIHRFVSARSLIATAADVNGMLAWFADERALPYASIDVPPLPGVNDAVRELRERSGGLVDDGKGLVVSLARRKGSRTTSHELPAASPVSELSAEASGGAVVGEIHSASSDTPAEGEGAISRLAKVRKRATTQLQRRGEREEGENGFTG